MNKIVFTLVAAVVVGFVAITITNRNHLHRDAHWAEIRSEAKMLRERMKNAYRKRSGALRIWTGGTALGKSSDFNGWLAEEERTEFQTQIEFDRFDWVEAQLGRTIALLLADKKAGRKKPKDWERLEREIADAREAYDMRAITANRREKLPEHIPVFRGEEALAPDTP